MGFFLFELAADELHEPFIAHFVRSAFRSNGVFELGNFGEVMDELLLHRSGAGHMDFFGVLHVAGDFLEELVLQRLLPIVRGILVGVAIGSWIAGVAQYGKFLGGRISTADDAGTMGVHPNPELLPVFY